MTRSKTVNTIQKTKWLPSCDGLPKDCTSMKIQTQDTAVKCKFFCGCKEVLVLTKSKFNADFCYCTENTY